MSAPNPASAANTIAIDSTGGVIYSPANGPAREIMICNRSTNSVALLVNISGMHKSGEFAGLEPSTVPRLFRASNLSLGTVTVKSASSTAVIDWGITEV